MTDFRPCILSPGSNLKELPFYNCSRPVNCAQLHCARSASTAPSNSSPFLNPITLIATSDRVLLLALRLERVSDPSHGAVAEMNHVALA